MRNDRKKRDVEFSSRHLTPGDSPNQEFSTYILHGGKISIFQYTTSILNAVYNRGPKELYYAGWRLRCLNGFRKNENTYPWRMLKKRDSCFP